MPADFPSTKDDALMAFADNLDKGYRATHGSSPAPAWSAFVRASYGVLYRWRALAEADITFAKTVETPEQQFQQESALFSFFTCALSVVELSCFAFYAFAAQINPGDFGQVTKNPRTIVPQFVRQQFERLYPGESIAITIASCLDSQMFADISDIRNELSHRGTAERGVVLYMTPETRHLSHSTWRGDRFDAKLTEGYRTGLAAHMDAMFSAAVAFGTAHIV